MNLGKRQKLNLFRLPAGMDTEAQTDGENYKETNIEFGDNEEND